MRILVIEPLVPPYEREINGSLTSMQKVVGGYIQAIYPFEDESIALICNEEGKLMELPYNRSLFDESGNIYDIITGTFFLCSAPPDSEKFESLNESQMEFCKEQFSKIEIYVKGGNINE